MENRIKELEKEVCEYKEVMMKEIEKRMIAESAFFKINNTLEQIRKITER